MTAITDKANTEYRDMESPGSGAPHEPEKTGIRELFAVIDAALGSLGVNGAITVKKATRGALFADLAHDADDLAVVYNDATAANNGIYAKVGGSGSGSWSLTALALPSSFATDLAEVLANQVELEADIAALENAAAVFASAAETLGVTDGVVTWDGSAQEYTITPVSAFQGPPGTLVSNSGFTASGPVIIQDDSDTVFRVLQSDGTEVLSFDTLDAFTGYGGAMTEGAGRMKIGSGSFSTDDAALLIHRVVVGPGFSHAVRDESTVNMTAVGKAYASYDAVAEMIGTGSPPPTLDHFRGFQARQIWNRDGDLSQWNGFGSNPNILQGTVASVVDYYVANGVIDPAAVVSNRFGLYMDVLTGATTNVSIFVQNDSYLLGNLFLDGAVSGVTTMTASGELKGSAIHGSGGVASFEAGGGVIVAKPGAYGLIRSYVDGTGAPQGLHINPTVSGTPGGQVLINGTSQTTGKELEVVGSISVSGAYYVDDVQVVGNQGASLPADATDLATVITLANATKSRAVAHGLVAP